MISDDSVITPIHILPVRSSIVRYGFLSQCSMIQVANVTRDVHVIFV